MVWLLTPLWAVLAVSLLAGPAPAHQDDVTVKVIVTEATYVMGDSDTLAGAEENALLRAKRKAVEEAGVYIETTSQDVETAGQDKSTRLSSLSIKTISAAITETEILERRRTMQGDRLAFYVKIRAKIPLDKLEEAVRRHLSDEQLAQHQRQLEHENTALKEELDHLRGQLQDTKAQQAPSDSARNPRTARDLMRTAMQAHSLPEKIDLVSRAITADNLYADAYVVRGQTYLRIASLAYANKKRRPEINGYVEQALADFERALVLDASSPWALLGHGDTLTWLHRMDEAAQDYERILAIDPLFDVARQRLIALYTTQAQKQAAARKWPEAIETLDKVLKPNTPASWVAQQKDAYLLRSHIRVELGQTEKAIEDLSQVVTVDPTNVNAYLQRARLYRTLLQGRLAKDDFERACSLGSREACDALP